MLRKSPRVVLAATVALVAAVALAFAAEARPLPVFSYEGCHEPVSPVYCYIRTLRQFLGAQTIKINKDNPLDYRYLPILHVMGFDPCRFWELHELIYLGNCTSLMQLVVLHQFQWTLELTHILLVFEFEDEPYVFSHPYIVRRLGDPLDEPFCSWDDWEE